MYEADFSPSLAKLHIHSQVEHVQVGTVYAQL